MKRLYSAIACACVLLLIGTCAPAYAGLPGSSCTDAIPMGENYSVEVRNGQTIWYSAWTFDLPLTVTFAPKFGENEPAPDVEMDFTCLPGYYKDSILCNMFCKTSGGSGFSIEMPHKPNLSSKKLDDGTFVYYLSLGKKYRDLLLQMGISYNLEVYVKVTYKCDGTISLVPDGLFTNCVDKAKFMRIGDSKNDTVHVKANDKTRHVIIPYVQWQEDTIIYKWTGTAPCTMSVANTCEFDPLDTNDDNIIQKENDIQPGDSIKTEATVIYDWVHNPLYPNEAGMYFAKFYTEGTGTMKITKAKQAVPDGKATLLRFGKTYALDANTTAIFAIPRSWNIDVKFLTPTSHLFSMEVSPTTNFEADALKTYSFERTNTGRWLGITGSELNTFWEKVPASRHYLYIRFHCTEATTISPERWNVSDCYTKTAKHVVVPDAEITVKKQDATVYRFSYPQWVGGNMTIKFALNNDCFVYLADTCGMARTNENAPYWLKYKAKVKSSQPLVITADEIASWADKIDEEGYFYALFYADVSSTNRKLTFTSEAPEETDPVYPASSVSVTCDGGQVEVNVSEEQHITIWSAIEEKVDEWEATPDSPKVLKLTPGTYVLEGKSDKIQLIL